MLPTAGFKFWNGMQPSIISVVIAYFPGQINNIDEYAFFSV